MPWESSRPGWGDLPFWVITTTGKARWNLARPWTTRGSAWPIIPGSGSTKARARLRICGVGDLWTDRQNLPAALGDATERDAVILLSHNPDFAETLEDRRVGLILSGHTHGGQVVLPGFGAPIVPSRYGQKYLHGLVQGPRSQVFISRGVGTVTPPIRFFCRPEIVLITLV